MEKRCDICNKDLNIDDDYYKCVSCSKNICADCQKGCPPNYVYCSKCFKKEDAKRLIKRAIETGRLKREDIRL